jgi:uncharacterized membrane protein YhhN
MIGARVFLFIKGAMDMSNYGIAALCFGIMTGLYLCYQAEKFRKKGNKKRELALKGGTTLTAALLAGYGYAMTPTPALLMIMIGLFVCAVADVVLDRHFLAGTVAFGLGHICYCAAYLLSAKPGIGSLILFLVMAGIMMILYPKLKEFSAPNSALPYLGYAWLISAMLALALPQRPLVLAGALLFVLSDSMLLARIVRKITSKKYNYLCLGIYFLAQFLIAASAVL